MPTYLDSHLITHFTVRVPKEYSAFFYFTLQAQDGLCSFSTVNESLELPYRDIAITGTVEFRHDILHTLHVMGSEYSIPLDILSDTIIDDHHRGGLYV